MKTDNEILDDILSECLRITPSSREMSKLIELSVGDKKIAEDDCQLRLRITRKIEDEKLLTHSGSGWAANELTQKIADTGGYIEYMAHHQRRESLQLKADEARNRTAIVQWRTIKWSFGFSAAAILIAIAALIVSISTKL